MKRVLLTTIHQPLGVHSETCTPNIQAEMYHAQVTLAQGPFSIRSVCTGWGLEFIAANLEAPTTVLHYPTKERLLRELRTGYDFVGIGFVICTFPKAIEMCRLIRRVSPETRIILGGYGTVLTECDQYADYVCREEGVNFMRRLLSESEIDRRTIPNIERTLKVFSVTTRPEVIIPVGLGCSRGCDFCCTSHFFDRQYVPLIKSGRDLHEQMRRVKPHGGGFRNIGIIDEDFLADRSRMEDVIKLNPQEVDHPILFSCLTSLQSLSQYTTMELLQMGLSGAWVGIESKWATYPKLQKIDAARMISELKGVGISMLASMIIGYDWHDKKTIEEDFAYLMSLRPTFSQFMIYSPCPQTPLYRKLVQEGRLLNVPYKLHDGFHLLFKHPHFSSEELEQIVGELFVREYEELGPSILRVLENQLDGYLALRDSGPAWLRARAREHKNLCLEIYPLLRLGIRRAPSEKVKAHLLELRDRIESELNIPLSARTKTAAVPLLSLYSAIITRLNPHPQPKVQVTRYRWNHGEEILR